jgi:hypothetical protein
MDGEFGVELRVALLQALYFSTGQTFCEVMMACTAHDEAPCTIIKILIVIGDALSSWIQRKNSHLVRNKGAAHDMATQSGHCTGLERGMGFSAMIQNPRRR